MCWPQPPCGQWCWFQTVSYCCTSWLSCVLFRVLFIHVVAGVFVDVCFVILIFCLPFCVCVWLYVSKVHCWSVLEPDASGLPYYCAPFVCVLNGLGGLAVWQFTNKQTNKQTPSPGCVPQALWFIFTPSGGALNWACNGPGKFLGFYVISRVLDTRLGRTLTLYACLFQLLLVL